MLMSEPNRAANVLLASYLAETRLARALNSTTPVTRSVLGLLVLAHLGLSIAMSFVQGGHGLEGARFADVLVFAALIPEELAAGAVWRAFSGQLAHADILHLAFNLLTFGIVAPLAERLYGSVRFIILLGCAALAAALLVALFGEAPAVGASALIFGVLGGFVAFALKEKRRLPKVLSQTLLKQSLVVLMFGVLVGLLVPGFNNLAHVGGALGGLGAGWLVAPQATRDGRMAGLVDAIATTVAALVLFGGVMTAAEVRRCGGSYERLLVCYPDFVLTADEVDDDDVGEGSGEDEGSGASADDTAEEEGAGLWRVPRSEGALGPFGGEARTWLVSFGAVG